MRFRGRAPILVLAGGLVCCANRDRTADNTVAPIGSGDRITNDGSNSGNVDAADSLASLPSACSSDPASWKRSDGAVKDLGVPLGGGGSAISAGSDGRDYFVAWQGDDPSIFGRHVSASGAVEPHPALLIVDRDHLDALDPPDSTAWVRGTASGPVVAFATGAYHLAWSESGRKAGGWPSTQIRETAIECDGRFTRPPAVIGGGVQAGASGSSAGPVGGIAPLGSTVVVAYAGTLFGGISGLSACSVEAVVLNASSTTVSGAPGDSVCFGPGGPVPSVAGTQAVALVAWIHDGQLMSARVSETEASTSVLVNGILPAKGDPRVGIASDGRGFLIAWPETNASGETEISGLRTDAMNKTLGGPQHLAVTAIAGRARSVQVTFIRSAYLVSWLESLPGDTVIRSIRVTPHGTIEAPPFAVADGVAGDALAVATNGTTALYAWESIHGSVMALVR